MTRAHTIELESAVLFAAAAVAGMVFALTTNHTIKNRTIFNLPVIAPLVSPTPSATPTPTPTSFSQTSPDGKKEVTMVVSEHSKTTKNYTFIVSDGDGSNKQDMYAINLPFAQSMSIPFNAFSPDDKYVFVQHNTADSSEALVFRVDGQPIVDTTQYLNVKDIYAARGFANTYQTTTGWASETLLIVNTVNSSGEKSASYWVEIPSKAVIPLATEF